MFFFFNVLIFWTRQVFLILIKGVTFICGNFKHIEMWIDRSPVCFVFFIYWDSWNLCSIYTSEYIERVCRECFYSPSFCFFFEMLRIFIIEPLLFLWVGKSSVSRVFVIFYFTKKYAVLLLSLELNILVNRRPGDVLLFTSEYLCIFHVVVLCVYVFHR